MFIERIGYNEHESVQTQFTEFLTGLLPQTESIYFSGKKHFTKNQLNDFRNKIVDRNVDPEDMTFTGFTNMFPYLMYVGGTVSYFSNIDPYARQVSDLLRDSMTINIIEKAAATNKISLFRGLPEPEKYDVFKQFDLSTSTSVGELSIKVPGRHKTDEASDPKDILTHLTSDLPSYLNRDSTVTFRKGNLLYVVHGFSTKNGLMVSRSPKWQIDQYQKSLNMQNVELFKEYMM